jgi:ABC-type dipeptide/oligopeptide/nickel transport system permease subunit
MTAASPGSSPSAPKPPGWRERLARRPLGGETWAGLVLLGIYVGVALSAVIAFGASLDRVPTQIAWIPPPPFFRNTLGPSAAHPFGVLPGIGTDLFRAVWQATPWDLAIVAGILVFDVAIGWTLGALAGMNEGGPIDSVVRFVGDTIGAIPSFFWVIALLAGLAFAAPGALTLPVFVVVFGMVIWPTTARTTRERARAVAREPFLESARASGARPSYLYFRHILPNSVSPLLAQIPIDVAPIFFVLTTFPWFWDCAGPNVNHKPGGVPVYYIVPTIPPFSPLPSVNFPEWGNLLAVGTCEGLPISTAGPVFWWMFVPTLIAILGLGIGIALVCDGLSRRSARADRIASPRARRPPKPEN